MCSICPRCGRTMICKNAGSHGKEMCFIHCSTLGLEHLSLKEKFPKEFSDSGEVR